MYELNEKEVEMTAGGALPLVVGVAKALGTVGGVMGLAAIAINFLSKQR